MDIKFEEIIKDLTDEELGFLHQFILTMEGNEVVDLDLDIVDLLDDDFWDLI